MINLLVTRFTKMLVKKNFISFEQYELCLLGFEMILTTILQLGVLLGLGALTGYFLETMVFLVCFSSLRVYAGGVHAPSVWLCTLIMATMICADLALVDGLGIYKSYANVLLINTINFGLLLYYSVFPSIRVFQKTRHIKISKCLIVFMGFFIAIAVLSQKGEFWSRLAGIGSIAMLFESLTLIKIKIGGKRDEKNYEESMLD